MQNKEKITIFGSFNEDMTDSELVFIIDFIEKNNIKEIAIGGYVGQLKIIADYCSVKKIKVTIFLTELGFKEYYSKEVPSSKIQFHICNNYFDKKSLLLSYSQNYLFLPVSNISLGLLTEVFDTLDYITNYCSFTKNKEVSVDFIGDTYKAYLLEIQDNYQKIFFKSKQINFI